MTMNAGVAKIDITPPLGIPLAGSFSVRLGSHVEERLHARALVFEQDGQRHAVVTADALGFRRDVVARLRRHRRRRFGIQVMLFNATHNQGGPNVCWEWSVNEPASARKLRRVYDRTFERKLEQVVTAAARRLRPVTVSYGTGQVGFGINRRCSVAIRSVPYQDRTGRFRSSVFDAGPETGLGAEDASRQPGEISADAAAAAPVLEAILVTNNTAHFSRVQGLRCENWGT